MAEYIEVGQLWNCETCFHHQNGKCSPAVWCDHGESYRPAYDKLKKADVEEIVRCKDCIRCGEERSMMGHALFCRHWVRNTEEDGYCHEGVAIGGKHGE